MQVRLQSLPTLTWRISGRARRNPKPSPASRSEKRFIELKNASREPIRRRGGDCGTGQRDKPRKNDRPCHWEIGLARRKANSEEGTDRNMRRRNRKSEQAREHHENCSGQVRGKALAMIHCRDFFAHRLGDFSRVKQPADGHGSCDGSESPAPKAFGVERFPQKQERNNFRRVVQAAGEADGTGTEKMARIHDLLRADPKKRPGVTLATVLLFVDCEGGYRSNAAKSKDRRGLRHRHNLFLSSDANTPFLGDAGGDPECAKQNVKNSGACDREDRTEQQRRHESFGQR